MNFSSKLFEAAVNEFSQLPGVGKKTALRYVLHLIKQDAGAVEIFSNTFIRLKKELKFCVKCHNIADNELCEICDNPQRNHTLVCVTEGLRDVMAIENTQQYKGVYHVLGGIISPMDGIGPANLNIQSLINRVASGEINEIIMALSTTMEGDTTNFYIYKKLKSYNIPITTIARGVSIGDELEYADEITLGRSIINRTLYENSISFDK